MAFSITYHQPTHANAVPHSPHCIEWITPEGWDASRARASFEAQNPRCTVLRCDDIGNPYGNLA